MYTVTKRQLACSRQTLSKHLAKISHHAGAHRHYLHTNSISYNLPRLYPHHVPSV